MILILRGLPRNHDVRQVTSLWIVGRKAVSYTIEGERGAFTRRLESVDRVVDEASYEAHRASIDGGGQ